MARNSDSKEKNEDGLTVKQEKFLLLFPETLNIYRTAERVGIARSNIVRDVQRDTPFGRAVRELSKRLDDDPRFSKAGTLSDLYDMEKSIIDDETMESKDKFRLLLDIKKEINKMIDGNIASQKKTIENKNLILNATYDMTKLPERQEQKTIDIGYEEADG